jgi:hypothetical protein
MSNLRIVFSNAANRAATLAAAAEAGALVAANLLTDIKSQVYRSTSTSATLTLTWASAEIIKCVALPYTNFTKNATMRVRGYTNTGDASPAFDTTALACCPYSAASVFGWDIKAPGVANFGYGGAVYAVLWFTGGAVKKLVIDLADAGNTTGYIETGRLIVGDYWSPDYNADYGLQLGYVDASEHKRNEAGDLMTDIRPRSKSLSFGLGDATPADRKKLMRILRGNGMPGSIFISVFPGDADQDKEQDYQLYGKLSQLSALTLARFESYTSSITIDEI